MIGRHLMTHSVPSAIHDFRLTFVLLHIQLSQHNCHSNNLVCLSGVRNLPIFSKCLALESSWLAFSLDCKSLLRKDHGIVNRRNSRTKYCIVKYPRFHCPCKICYLFVLFCNCTGIVEFFSSLALVHLFKRHQGSTIIY